MNRRGQSTAEYAIVFAVILAAVVGMQIYVKRGAQARLKVGVDELTSVGTRELGWLDTSEQAVEHAVSITTHEATTDGQYEPYYAESSYGVSRTSTVEEDIDLKAGTITRDIVQGSPEVTTRKATGYQKQRSATEGEID